MSENIARNRVTSRAEEQTALRDSIKSERIVGFIGALKSVCGLDLEAPSTIFLTKKCAVGSGASYNLCRYDNDERADVTVAGDRRRANKSEMNIMMC